VSKRSKQNRRLRKPLAKKTKRTSHKEAKPSQPQRESLTKSQQKDDPAKPQQQMTSGRLWLFRLVSVVLIPALLIGIAEAFLRIVDYGFSPKAIIKCEVQGTKCYRDNVKFAWQFFPPKIARQFGPFVFPSEKSDKTYRIFILGGSAAHGTPQPEYGFGRILRVLLEESYPGTNFEVIPTAMPAINSHVVLQIAKDCARHDPDLFVLYLGNNEVVGPYGAGTVFSPISHNLMVIRTGIALKRARLVQLLGNILKLVPTGADRPEVWGGLEMFLEKQVRPGDTSLEYVYKHFQENLKDIIKVGQRNGVKIILCTVGSNLKDCPPFASLHSNNITKAKEIHWDEIYKEGVKHEEAKQHRKAIEKFLAADAIDDCYADLHFRLGRCYWALGEYEESRKRYVKAREFDTLRFRADKSINAIIRDVATAEKTEGVRLADAVKTFEQNSPHQTPGEELFLEHVHLNFKGNYLLAKTVFDKIEEMLPEEIKRKKADDRLKLDETHCARVLAYTDWDRYKIALAIYNASKAPPYTNQLYHDERLSRTAKSIQEQKAGFTHGVLQNIAAQYHSAIERNPRDWLLRWQFAMMLTEALKDYPAAVQQYRLLLKYSNYDAAHSNLGGLLHMLGNTDEGIAHCQEAIRIRPTCADAHYNLAGMYESRGHIQKALDHYYTTLRLRPNYLKAHLGLIQLLERKKQIDEAVRIYRKTLRYMRTKEEKAGTHCKIADLLLRHGRPEEGVAELYTAKELDPNSAQVRQRLEAFQRGLRKSN